MSTQLQIYFLHRDARLCAQWLHDRDLVAQIRGIGQILSTACQMMGVSLDRTLYEPVQIDHPCNVWARESIEHFTWLHSHWLSLIQHHEELFHRPHTSWDMQLRIRRFYLADKSIGGTGIAPFPRAPWRDPPLLVPNEFVSLDTVKSYRAYYLRHRVHLGSYRKVRRPFWVDEYLYGSTFNSQDADLAQVIARAEELSA